ncbi:MAG: hypothetical protein GX847_09385 [Clostridiales bacterium]|nr:hypothetical protein [Clostridiales bacterium]
MSAAYKKTKRNADGFDSGKKMKSKGENIDSSKRLGKIAGITTIVVVVLFLISLFIGSNYFRQKFTAVSIDNVKYSITDFNYYYENVYIQYYNAMSGAGDFGSSMLPSRDTPLKNQIYNEETGETWSDFFEKMALEQMKEDNKIYLEAKKAGYQLPDEIKAEMETEIENLKSMGYATGYSDFSDYLRAAYGKSMTEKAYAENLERSYLIDAYVNHVRDSYEYTPEQIEDYYRENKDKFDTFTYRYFLVSAVEIDKAEYPDETLYEEAKAEAVKEAGLKAQEYAEKITDTQSFIDAAREYDSVTYKDDDASQRIYKGELLGSIYGDWLRDEGRRYGDVSTFEMTNGHYVVMFEARDDNHYLTVNVQQIVVQQETVNKENYSEDEDGAAYEEAVATAKKTAKDTADKIHDEWLSGGATQDKLTELTTTYSMEISPTDSKLNENVYKNQLPAEVDSWIYDPDRKPGDNTVIYVESVGYYILNFIGNGEMYSDILSDTQKRDKDLQAWKESLPFGEPKTTWLMALKN